MLMHADNGGVDHLDSGIMGSGKHVYDNAAPDTSPPLGEPCAVAALWQDPLDPECHHVLRLSKAGKLFSTRLGSSGGERSIDLTEFLPDSDEYSTRHTSLLQGDEIYVSELEGFPCVIASLSIAFIGGRIVHFLDPATLRPIRPARYFGDAWSEFRLARGRWLVATRISGPGPRPLLAMWDLTDPRTDPIGEWCAEAGDIYRPLVVPAGPDDFYVYFTLRIFPESKYYLCRFQFRSREIERLLENPDLRTYPVSEASTD